MAVRYFFLVVLLLLFAVLGYFFFAIVVAIYAGLWLTGEKMYFEIGIAPHLFGAAGAAFGVGIAWAVWRLGRLILRQHG